METNNRHSRSENEMTEAIGMIQTIIRKPGLSGLAVAANKYEILPSLEQA